MDRARTGMMVMAKTDIGHVGFQLVRPGRGEARRPKWRRNMTWGVIPGGSGQRLASSVDRTAAHGSEWKKPVRIEK